MGSNTQGRLSADLAMGTVRPTVGDPKRKSEYYQMPLNLPGRGAAGLFHTGAELRFEDRWRKQLRVAAGVAAIATARRWWKQKLDPVHEHDRANLTEFTETLKASLENPRSAQKLRRCSLPNGRL